MNLFDDNILKTPPTVQPQQSTESAQHNFHCVPTMSSCSNNNYIKKTIPKKNKKTPNVKSQQAECLTFEIRIQKLKIKNIKLRNKSTKRKTLIWQRKS